MYLRALKYLPATAILHVTIGGLVYAQTAGPTATGATELTNAIRLNTFENATLDVYLKGADGKPVEVAAVVTLLQLSNEAYRQETAKAGHVRFQSIKATEYFVQVIDPGYQTAVKQVEARKDETRQVTIELRELSVEDVAENAAYRALAPKAQKEIGKALERLRAQKLDDARSHLDAANRAGHEQAAMVQPVLAGALARKGEKERAVAILQNYLKEHPLDDQAKKLQEGFERIATSDGRSAASALPAEELSLSTSGAAALPLPLSWLPPDVDEKMPPVEPGVTCALEEVLEKAGKRAQVFVKNVERFTASEFLKQETIDKWGIAGAAETRKFNYVAAIEEPQPGFLIVEEYRDSGGSPAEFPGGVETSGLAALALIFHPYYAGNFDMTCEGLTRWNGTPAWQVHFRQRRDKPNTVRSYRLGLEGPSYPVALKGRAWILRDSFDIARLETDLIAPVPQIKLVADHTAIEYGPVRFHIPDAEMWLPQSAEVYYDWRGKRIHRRHSFSHYLLFVVDEKQHIAEPKPQN